MRSAELTSVKSAPHKKGSKAFYEAVMSQRVLS